MLELQNITATDRGITDLSFSLNPGEIVAIIGLNGAGKTTFFRLALGILRPDSGAITCTVSKGELGQLINVPFAYPELTVQQNLHMLSQLYSMNPTCITNSLEQWKLERYCNDQFRHLSLGNKQRVGLAGALQHQPRLILLDEPTNALDPLGIMILRETLMQRARMGCGVVVSSHHLDEVSAIADRIVVLHAGRIIAELPAHTPNLEQQFFQLILTEDQTHERGK